MMYNVSIAHFLFQGSRWEGEQIHGFPVTLRGEGEKGDRVAQAGAPSQHCYLLWQPLRS